MTGPGATTEDKRTELRGVIDAAPLSRIAGAPISWGVSEVAGWGYQLHRERVLDEMRELGLGATELGPPGFLPDDPARTAAFLASKGLRSVGGFLPVVLHDPDLDPVPAVEAYLADCLAGGGDVIILAAATGLPGYDDRPVLREDQWATLYRNLDRIADHVAVSGLTSVLHPHMGTVIQNDDEVSRLLKNSKILLCVDTGHLLAAGADPVAITRSHPLRVGHVHLKDVNIALAEQVQDGRTTFSRAVADGLFCPLGTGGVDVAALVGVLEGAGYRGWYVLEQDLKLENGAPEGIGPMADVGRSLDFVVKVLSETWNADACELES